MIIMICALLTAGYNANSILFPSYSTPLHIAATSGSKESVVVLLFHGAIPDICNNEGKTAFHQVKVT